MPKKRLWPGLCPGPRWESLQCSPRSPSWFWGGRRGGGRDGEKGKGKGEETHQPSNTNTCVQVF